MPRSLRDGSTLHCDSRKRKVNPNRSLSSEDEELIDLIPRQIAAIVTVKPTGCWGGAPQFWHPHVIILEAAPDPAVEAAEQCDLVRDILGNPFRPVTPDPVGSRHGLSLSPVPSTTIATST
jgi:hypothetical protein